MKYVEYAIGKVSNRNLIVELKKLPLLIKTAQSEGKDLYRSYYCYDDDIIEHFKLYKTVRSFKGKYYLDNIKIDVDKGTKRGDTKEESDQKDQILLMKVRLLCEELIDNWKLEIDCIQCWYSGSGFHIIVPDFFGFVPSNYMPAEVKNTMNKYFGAMDSMPLMNTGLFRVGYTVNYKTGLYKTIFTVDEIRELTIDEIKNIAKTHRRRSEISKFKTDTLVRNYDLIVKETVQRVVEANRTDTTRIVTCVQNIYNKGASEGNRHEAMLLMIGTWRSKGLNIEQCRVLIKEWNKKGNSLAEYEVDKQIDYIYEKGYNPGCEHVIRQKYCDSKCIHYEAKNYSIQIHDSYYLSTKLAEFYHSDYKKKRYNLKQFGRLDNDFFIYPGEFIVLTGMSGIGKSALAQNLSNDMANSGLTVLYLNFEFQANLFFRRLTQIALGKTKDEMEEFYSQCNASEANKVGEKLKNIYVMDFPPFIDDLPAIIQEKNPQVIIIDTFDEVMSKRFKDETSKSMEVAMALKKVATQLDKIIITVNHVPKSACYDDRGKIKALTLSSIKGSVAIVQKADKVLAYEGDPEEKGQVVPRTLNSLKARDEKGFSKRTIMNWDTFQINT